MARLKRWKYRKRVRVLRKIAQRYGHHDTWDNQWYPFPAGENKEFQAYCEKLAQEIGAANGQAIYKMIGWAITNQEEPSLASGKHRIWRISKEAGWDAGLID